MDASHFILRTLIEDRLVTEADVARARDSAKGGDVLEALVANGDLTGRKLAVTRAKVCEYPFVELGEFEIDLRNAKLLPRALAEKHVAFPLFFVDGVATVAVHDPLNLHAVDQVRAALQMEVDPVVCEAAQLRALIARAYGLSATIDVQEAARSTESDLAGEEEPIVAAVNQIIVGAVEAGASDVHLNPDENELHLRYRVDGVLRVQQGPSRAAHAGLVQRLKVLARLDLTQTRKPQDGKFRFVHGSVMVDIRLSTTPTLHGENVVLRLLRPASTIGGVADLDMPLDIQRSYEQYIRMPHGMILVTGPTGSGKTTTLYTALNAINAPTRNVMTIEDPVEIRLPMVRQIQVNTDIGLTFSSALRSVLRQDPDVVLVGEIRDQETAKIAVQAALTGHLVFSTLHTNDAIGSIARLRDFEVPPFAINNAVLCVIAQRLIRRVCPKCAAPDRTDPGALASFNLSAVQVQGLRRGTGCGACSTSGYRGRIGAFEMLRLTTPIKRLVERGAPLGDIEAAALEAGMRPMWLDGLDKALKGLTTLDELARLRTEIELDSNTTRKAA